MNVRFIIRRDVDDALHKWSLRDALCASVELHDFSDFDWPDNCFGACDTSQSWRSVMNIAAETLVMDRGW